MWREEGTDQNKHLVVVTYFTVFRLPELVVYCRSHTGGGYRLTTDAVLLLE
jgi:hypothetical protein